MQSAPDGPQSREDVYGKIMRLDTQNAARSESQVELEWRRVQMEQEKTARTAEEKEKNRKAHLSQAEGLSRVLTHMVDSQQAQSQRPNQVLRHIPDSQIEMNQGFLAVITRLLERK
jgi:hypothetical protein